MLQAVVEIRRVEAFEVTDNWLDRFVRYQESGQWYQREGEELVLRTEQFVDDWTMEEKKEKVADIRSCLAEGGRLAAALVEGEPVGFALVAGRLIEGCVELSKLHVSLPDRHKGIGSRLFTLACEMARETGATWMFISSNPAAATQQYYKAVGCVNGWDLRPLFPTDDLVDLPLKYKLEECAN